MKAYKTKTRKHSIIEDTRPPVPLAKRIESILICLGAFFLGILVFFLLAAFTHAVSFFLPLIKELFK